MTPKQLILLNFIRNKVVYTGLGPTFKEMRQHMNVSSNQTVDDFLSSLEKEGFIKIISGKQRGIRITEKGQKVEEIHIGEEKNIIQTSFTYFSSNASASFTPSNQIVSNINFQSNGIVSWRKGGERNGTT